MLETTNHQPKYKNWKEQYLDESPFVVGRFSALITLLIDDLERLGFSERAKYYKLRLEKTHEEYPLVYTEFLHRGQYNLKISEKES